MTTNNTAYTAWSFLLLDYILLVDGMAPRAGLYLRFRIVVRPRTARRVQTLDNICINSTQNVRRTRAFYHLVVGEHQGPVSVQNR